MITPTLTTGTKTPTAFIRSLVKSESNSLGFLSDEALDWYAHEGMVLGGAVNGDPTCFALGKLGSPTYPDACSLYMTAVRHDARQLQHARWLIGRICGLAIPRGLSRIQLWCRADLQANEVFSRVGFDFVGARPGGSGRKIPHICWMLDLSGGGVGFHQLSTRRRGRAGTPIAFAPDVTLADVMHVCRTDPANLLYLTAGTRATADEHSGQLSLWPSQPINAGAISR